MRYPRIPGGTWLLILALAAVPLFAGDGDDEDWKDRQETVDKTHRAARQEARQIAKVHLRERLADNQLRRQLQALQVTQLDAQGITLPELLGDIRQQARDAGIRGFNVLYRCDQRKLRRPVNLSLTDIGFLPLLDMLTRHNQLNYVIEPHALVIVDKPAE